MTPERALLGIASLLAPSSRRGGWLADWQAELWHARPQHSRPQSLAMCMGAFADAWWLRRNYPDAGRAHLQSPVACLGLLTALAAVSVWFALKLPWPYNPITSPYRDPARLVMVSADGSTRNGMTTGQYGALRTGAGHAFTELAYYQPERMRLRTPQGRSEDLLVARASRNLFAVLGVSVPLQGAASLIVSRSALHGRRIGETVHIAGEDAVIAGILPPGQWLLPGRIDAWLLTGQLPAAESKGLVLGRIRTSELQPRSKWEWHVSIANESGRREWFVCHSLTPAVPLADALLMLLMALLILPATTSLALGEYPTEGFRRWAFLALKIMLLVAIVAFGTSDLASLARVPIQAHGMLVGFVAVLRWALIDQRQRCPVCLRRLSNPARIGTASQIFVDWYGTELMCVRGHGLLHVPAVQMSYSTQRWLVLDRSWSGLFW